MSNVVPIYRLSKETEFTAGSDEVSLKSGDGGGTFQSMEPASKEYVNLKLEATMARIEGRFDRIEGRFDRIEGKLDGKPGYAAMIGAAFTAAVGIVGIIIAVLAFGSSRFDGGLGLADQRQGQLERDALQDDAISRLRDAGTKTTNK